MSTTPTPEEIESVLARADAWEAVRVELNERDGNGEDPVSSSEWQNNDDEGAALADELAELLRQPIKVWTCAVKTPDSPGLVAFARLTEGECFEALREAYDPEGDADDEPPVAIVEHLENDGYLINIDVHEVTR